MKTSKLLAILFVFGLCASFVACGNGGSTKIALSDEQILVNGDVASTNAEDAVYVANDIVASEEIETAKDHAVVHITKPGTYKLSGTLSAGQIAVDLGEDAKADPKAVVTLILDNADITCNVAPAIVIYNAYECVSSDSAETVNTKNAGANIFINNKTTNALYGGYVADKYEAAVYSTVTMNIDGKAKGELFVNAFTDLGDGIYSDGYLTINGGKVNASACSITGNAGIASDKGIFINGGNVVATGHVYDEIIGGKQNFAVFSFIESQMGGNIFEVKNAKEKTVLPALCNNDFTILVVSDKALKEKTYSFWCEDVQFFVGDGLAGGFMGDPTMVAPEGAAPHVEVDPENADIVFDIEKGENVFHVFY